MPLSITKATSNSGSNSGKPKKPHKTNKNGKFLLRISKPLHSRLAMVAYEQGVSLNSLITTTLAEAVEKAKAYEAIEKGLS